LPDEKEEDICGIPAAVQYSAHLIRFLGLPDAVFTEYTGGQGRSGNYNSTRRIV
jgi:hypothetical protein